MSVAVISVSHSASLLATVPPSLAQKLIARAAFSMSMPKPKGAMSAPMAHFMPTASERSQLVSQEIWLVVTYLRFTEVGMLKVTEVAPAYEGLRVRFAIGAGGAPSTNPKIWTSPWTCETHVSTRSPIFFPA